MKKILLLAGVFTTAVAMTASADTLDSLKGFRVGANLNTSYGANSINVPVSKFNGNTNGATGGASDKVAFGFNPRPLIGAGATIGYDCHRNFGLLFSYQYLGRRSVSGANGLAAAGFGHLVTDVWSLTGEGRLPLVDNLDLTARLGLSMISNRFSIRRGNTYNNVGVFTDNSGYRIKETQWGLNYGLGFQYHLNECTDIEAGVEAITPWNQKNLQGTYSTRFYLGAAYKF